jgi:phage anti-repressor protein
MSEYALLELQEKPDGTMYVLAGELYFLLEIQEPFAKWLDGMPEYGFVKGQDYTCLVSQGGKLLDYHLTLDMAQEIATMQRTELGRQARQFIIERKQKMEEAPVLPTAPPSLAALKKTFQTANKLVKQMVGFQSILENALDEMLGKLDNSGVSVRWDFERDGFTEETPALMPLQKNFLTVKNSVEEMASFQTIFNEALQEMMGVLDGLGILAHWNFELGDFTTRVFDFLHNVASGQRAVGLSPSQVFESMLGCMISDAVANGVQYPELVGDYSSICELRGLIRDYEVMLASLKENQ